MSESHTTSLLQGVRVLDLSQYIPGPYATRLMADLGADVLKIEPPNGEPMRQMMRARKDQISPLYLHLNRGKRVVFLDLKSTSGRDQLSNLVDGADVLLDGFRPGMLDKLGFDKARLMAINQRLILCRLSGFGLTGPNRMKAGHDIGYCAVAGFYSSNAGRYREALRGETNYANNSPVPEIPFPPIADHVGALQAVNSILAALVGRERSSMGCELDISLYESISSWQYFSSTPEVVDMLSGAAAYYNIYRTKDHRLITLGAIEPHFWEAFCAAVQRPQWLSRYHEPLPQNDLKQALSALFLTEALSYWVSVFRDVDCCFEPIPLSTEVFDHPQTSSRGISDGEKFSYPGQINHQTTPIRPPPEVVNTATWL